MKNIPILEWDDRDDTEGEAIMRVPYKDIDEIVEEVHALEVPPYGLLSPYKGDNQSFNARSASMLWDRLPSLDIFMPIATSNRVSLPDFVTATLKAGFQKLVVPYTYGYNGQYKFDSMMQFLHGVYDNETWFHVAGGEPTIPEHWKGIWTWSEETL